MATRAPLSPRFVSLAGRFIVLEAEQVPFGRRFATNCRLTIVTLPVTRLAGMVIPDGMSVILRTAGIDRTC